ncbi:MAG: RNA polymerase sigma factor, partial [Candidatus Promineifilaceae bacterium]
VARAQQGDSEAFGDLYVRYLDSIYRYIYYRIGNKEEAEDLTESVFLKAWRAIDNYQERGLPFQAWLYRIARNIVIDHRRKQKAQFVDIDTQFDLPDSSVQLESDIAIGLQVDTVLAAIKELEPLQQEVLTLRFLSELNHKEVAGILGKQVGAVRVLQHRALRALRRHIDRTGLNE